MRAVTLQQKQDVARRILEAWARVPSLRLGQLIDNAVHGTGPDLFYLEDEALAERLESFALEAEQIAAGLERLKTIAESKP